MIATCRLLNKTVELLVRQPWYGEATQNELEKLFVSNLYQIMELGFDLNIDKRQLEIFSKKFGNSPSPSEYMYFLTGILEQESTYILVNHYQILFLKSLSNALQKQYVPSFEKILAENGITPVLMNHIDNLYKNYVIDRNKISSSNFN